ncbi:LysM peptidoglycan-binding domain-containing protein [Gorillibacterium sp. CAU 1737]|uniref:LysM peptidoglycan-binding domain-containing protein n=1 Tax=Gorillibacterium sp. CAU 1737 TaxID=3140362 RepID=UPI0032619DE6
MTEPGSGLRFDIYERVHLPEGLDGIEELEEAELVPHIQVVEEEDYAVIKGSLWLGGTYRGDSGAAGQTLEHLIPVEITMPQNRITRLEDIRVEIDQFDVDLLSNRSLNVTGVLSLHGLEMLPFQASSAELQEEETVFAYQIPEPEWITAGYRSEEAPVAEAPEEEEEPEEEEAAGEAEENEAAENEAVGSEEAEEAEANESLLGVSLDPDQAEWDEMENADFSLLEAPVAPPEPKKAPVVTFPSKNAGVPSWNDGDADSDEEALGRQEVKVAISPKSELAHLHSLVRPSASQEDPSLLQENAPKAKDSVEWKKLFIREPEAGTFKKVRMCIVQKEETLESIAERYRKSARELALYNQLGSQPVDEGQVLLIPS